MTRLRLLPHEKPRNQLVDEEATTCISPIRAAAFGANYQRRIDFAYDDNTMPLAS